jgi:hypothetical protein
MRKQTTNSGSEAVSRSGDGWFGSRAFSSGRDHLGKRRPSANQKIEDYRVNLNGVSAVELEIVPDISGGGFYASLAQIRVA